MSYFFSFLAPHYAYSFEDIDVYIAELLSSAHSIERMRKAGMNIMESNTNLFDDEA